MSEPGQGDVPTIGVESAVEGHRAVLSVSGEVDLETAPRLRQTLSDLIARGGIDVTVDLSGLTFLDSTGIGVLVDVFKETARRGGSLVVRDPSPPVFRVLEITGLTELFGITG